MAASDDKLIALEKALADFASDLRVLRRLLRDDTQSALNKMRFVVERALHDLSKTNDVSWGKAEPTVENMIGPLVAAKVIPRNVAIHVRTVQTNASPGSHFQEAPLDDAHVEVAKLALIQFLEWYRSTKKAAPTEARESSEAAEKSAAAAPLDRADAKDDVRQSDARESDAALPKAASARSLDAPRERARAPWTLVGAAVLAGAGLAWYFGATGAPAKSAAGALAVSAAEPSTNAAPESDAAASAPSPLGAASASLRAPTVGLRAIDAFRQPTGKDSANLISEAYWQSAARDFEVASLQPSAPARWRAGLAFAKGEALVAKGAYDEADLAMKDAMAADPEWSVPHAGRAIALARKDAIEPALAEAREAERLEPDWIGGPWMAARVYARASKFDDAIQEYQRALLKDEKNAALLGDLAICYHGAHMDSEAERFSKRALEADPELASVHLMTAELALEKGDGQAALDHASQAVAILPTSASARLAEADAYALLKKTDDARRAYDKAVALYKELGGAGEIATRLEIVEKALAKGDVPPLRGQRKKTDRTQSREVHERSACSPGDPLCGVDL